MKAVRETKTTYQTVAVNEDTMTVTMSPVEARTVMEYLSSIVLGPRAVTELMAALREGLHGPKQS